MKMETKMETKMRNKNGEISTSYLLKRFFPYFRRYKGIMAFDLLCAALTTLCEIVLPLIVKFITNTATQNIEALTMNIVIRFTLIYILLRIIDVFANYYMQNTGHVMGARIERDMRTNLFEKYQELSYAFYSDNKTGQLISRITSDLFDIAEFAHHCPEEYFIAMIKVTASFIILVNVNARLTLILFLLILLMLFFAMKFRTKMRNAFKRQRVELGDINAKVEDSLLGIRVSKSFANEDVEQERFEEDNERFLDAKAVGFKSMAGFKSVTRFFDGLIYITLVLLGSIYLMRGSIAAGDFIAFLMYVGMLLESVRRVVEFTENFQRGITGLERFYEITDIPIEIDDSPDAVEMPKVKGEIEFKNVSFKYGDGDEVLHGIKLLIKDGENIALVGPSGAGKTTFCNLIPRFYDVTDGKIEVDGYDIRNVKLRSLRSNIGMVQQDVYLFSDSVKANIEYGKPGASDAEIIRAAKLAGAHEFISDLPAGYDTHVGEHGVKLSGGQKQRISIARVFLKNPPILILDEATSALDNESEMVVRESLAELAKGRTTITIAHRLTTIKNADRIIVLTENGIEEEGGHEELVKANGIYSHMYEMYSN